MVRKTISLKLLADEMVMRRNRMGNYSRTASAMIQGYDILVAIEKHAICKRVTVAQTAALKNVMDGHRGEILGLVESIDAAYWCSFLYPLIRADAEAWKEWKKILTPRDRSRSPWAIAAVDAWLQFAWTKVNGERGKSLFWHGIYEGDDQQDGNSVVDDVTVDTRTGEIIDGHARLKAAIEHGQPVSITPLDDFGVEDGE